MSEEAKDPDPKAFCVVTKDLIEDRFPILEWLQDEIAYATGAKERPVREERVIVPVEPTVAYADPKEALRALLDSGFESYEGMCDDRVCFHCGAMLDYEPHDSTCAYIAAKALFDALDGKE